MKLEFYSEAQKMWNDFCQNGISKYYDIEVQLELQKKILDIFHIGDFYYYIFDLKNFCFRYISSDIQKVLGFRADSVDLEFFLSKIHPDDQSTFLNHENTAGAFLRNLPLEKLTKYKVSYDYRIFNANGEQVRILQQVVTLQHDDEKNILLVLGVHTNISQWKKTNSSKLSFIGLEGEASYIDVNVEEVYKPSKSFFTKREKEIIHYLLKGMNSRSIARVLSISNHTVMTHRKNILAKTDTKNIIELANKIITVPLI